MDFITIVLDMVLNIGKIVLNQMDNVQQYKWNNFRDTLLDFSKTAHDTRLFETIASCYSQIISTYKYGWFRHFAVFF